MIARLCGLGLLGSLAACTAARPPEPAKSVMLVTIDTLRADHVGAYGATAARTPALDALARDGARFDRAWAPAPITLPSHASLLSGLYPPGHGSRHNGMAMQAVPTLATAFKAAGFATAAFVSAFPLDKRFGLTRGFDVYDDQLPRGTDGRPLNERPGEITVSRALAWLQAHGDERFFLWVHVFEPHAPYGRPGSGAALQARYDDDIAIADRELGRLVAALGNRAATTLVIGASDHGEAFGEHGEIGHSIFVYDTTLRVPLVMRGPGIRAGTVVPDDVSLVDLAPTLTALTGTPVIAGDGRSLVPALAGQALPAQPLYAESFAPLFDFGWAGLRAVREGPWKYIAAPRAELYDLARDPGESVNRVDEDRPRTARLDGEVTRRSPAEPGVATPISPEAAARLRSLGYLSGASRTGAASARPDPKDRIAVASRLATVTSGEVRGDELVATLEAVLRDDPPNPQAHLRMGFAEIERGRCAQAEPHLRAALDAGMPSADAGLGLAACYGQAGNLSAAREALVAARRAEPGNPVVGANLGILELAEGRVGPAVAELRRALAAEPSLLEARFALARALARSGDREGAAAEATTLLGQLPPDAPQRAEVRRLLDALR
jgi:choline-sulfatase